MKIKYVTVSAAAVAMASVALTGCGNDTKAYCDNLKSAKNDFGSLSSGDTSQLGEAFDAVSKIAKSAPEEVSGDWKTLDTAMQDAKKALDDAGIKPEDLAELQGGKLPDGVTNEDMQNLQKAFQEVSSSKTTKASDAIAKHAKKECNIVLS